MPEVSQIFQKQLDASQHCPVCQAAMYWVEAEYYHQAMNYHQCSHCDHCQFVQNAGQNCHCEYCLKQRKKSIQSSLYTERKEQQRKKQRAEDNLEYLLDDLSLLEKLFLLSLLDGTVDDHRVHDQFLDFSRYRSTHIAPSYQLFKMLKQQFINNDYLLEKTLLEKQHSENTEQYYTNLKLQGYREPSLLSITEQLRAWFYRDFCQGVPFRSSNEVKQTLQLILAHELLHFCQYRCQALHVQFYGNQALIDQFQNLLNELAVTQIYFLIDRALNYLAEKKLLQPSNQNYVNTNRLSKTLAEYRQRGIEQHWETQNLPRPQDIPRSQMTEIYLHRFLKLDERVYQQPLWKSWQLISPKLRFFAECHCIQCGSRDLTIEYSTEEYVSFSCLHCKQQDHYFI